jgi:hypothetical protein
LRSAFGDEQVRRLSAGPHRIATVGGTLSYIGNEPPFNGSFNTAAALEGQCTVPV